MLARAASEPRSLVIGIDASAAAMAEASRRAARGRGSRRLPNALFLAEAAERLPGPLAGVASLVTVTMPWGSLLRGVLGLDASVVEGTASTVAPGGRVEILASVVASDGVGGLETLDARSRKATADAWRARGLDLVSLRPATPDDLRAARSSWARRLGDRPAWRLEFVRTARRHDGLHSDSRSA